MDLKQARDEYVRRQHELKLAHDRIMQKMPVQHQVNMESILDLKHW